MDRLQPELGCERKWDFIYRKWQRGEDFRILSWTMT